MACKLCGPGVRCYGHTTKPPKDEYAAIEAEMRRRGARVNQPPRTKALERAVKAAWATRKKR